jgi:hypothetical protein
MILTETSVYTSILVVICFIEKCNFLLEQNVHANINSTRKK